MLDPRGRMEKRLGHGTPAVGVAADQKTADRLGRRRAAGLAGEDHVRAHCLEAGGEQPGLGGLAAALPALKADEAGKMLRCLSVFRHRPRPYLLSAAGSRLSVTLRPVPQRSCLKAAPMRPKPVISSMVAPATTSTSTSSRPGMVTTTVPTRWPSLMGAEMGLSYTSLAIMFCRADRSMAIFTSPATIKGTRSGAPSQTASSSIICPLSNSL